MGFFDTRCMISGLSLKGSDAVSVLLIKEGEKYQPTSLPIFGSYNRLGSIDFIEQNLNTEIVLKFFKSKINSGELKADWDEVDFDQVERIEQLFQIIERGVTMEYDAVTLNDRRIVFALIDKSIWNSICKLQTASTSMSFEGIMQTIYSQTIELDDLVSQFHAIQEFLVNKGFAWMPPTEHSQHYEEEIRGFIESAKNRFVDCPKIMEGIDTYEKLIEE